MMKHPAIFDRIQRASRVKEVDALLARHEGLAPSTPQRRAVRLAAIIAMSRIRASQWRKAHPGAGEPGRCDCPRPPVERYDLMIQFMRGSLVEEPREIDRRDPVRPSNPR